MTDRCFLCGLLAEETRHKAVLLLRAELGLLSVMLVVPSGAAGSVAMTDRRVTDVGLSEAAYLYSGSERSRALQASQ
jgi:hypothetical protein